MPNARTAIGNYDLLVLTERTSLSGTVPWHNSASEALRWFRHAHSNGANGEGAETILYATWVEITSGPDYENPWNDPEGHIPWRERLPLEFVRWMEISDFVNAHLPEGAAPMVRGEEVNTATTYGYDRVTMMQETKTTLCQVAKA
jgi:hypothetical protein